MYKLISCTTNNYQNKYCKLESKTQVTKDI